MNLFTKSILGAVVALLTTHSAYAQVLVVNGNLETNGADYSGSSYADQTNSNYPYNSSILGVGEPFQGYLTDADNYQIYQVSSAGKTGSFAGPTVIQVNGAGVKNYTLETLNPVGTVEAGREYILTFALANDGGGAGNATLSLFTATSAPNTTDFSGTHINHDPSNPNFYPAPPNPYPIITTGTIFAQNTISGGTINSQTVGNFVDYSITFDTFNGHNAGAVGEPLYFGLNLDSNGSMQFDNARLAVLPEPSTWALMLGGLAFLGYRLRRKAAATVVRA